MLTYRAVSTHRLSSQPMTIPYLYRAREAAAILRVSTRTLARWRSAGIIRATIVGKRSVRYTEAQIEAARRAAP